MNSRDWELLRRWQDGDRQAGTTLVQHYFPLISRFFVNKVSDPEDAGELVSDTFLACTKGKDRIRDGGNFRSYLFAIAMNQLRLYFRKKKKLLREREDFAEIVVAETVVHSMTSMMMQQRESQLIVQGLRTLPMDQQIVLELNLFESMSTAEIGELLGIPQGTVKSRMRLARQRLQRYIERAAANPKLCESTMTNMQGWALNIREQLGRTPE